MPKLCKTIKLPNYHELIRTFSSQLHLLIDGWCWDVAALESPICI